MENTEVINVEEIEVMEPVVTEVAETAENNTIGTVGGIVVGAVAVAGAVALWKFAIKPGVKKLKAKIEDKKRARELREARSSGEPIVTSVDFEEVKDSDNE